MAKYNVRLFNFDAFLPIYRELDVLILHVPTLEREIIRGRRDASSVVAVLWWSYLHMCLTLMKFEFH